MAATGLEVAIDLAGPRPRTQGTLLSKARRIPAEALSQAGVNRLPAGIEWLPWGDGGVTAEEVGCAVVYDKQARELPGLVYQPSFLIWDALTCSNLSGMLDELWDRIDHNLDVQMSYAFASQLEDAAQGGIGLIGADNYVGTTDYRPEVVTTAASSVQLAIALLEDFLAEKLRGGLGVIHLTPGLYSIAVAFGLVDSMLSTTPTGHAVVGDAGHSGQDTPTGGSAPGTGEAWAYATGDVWYAVAAQPRMLEAESGEGYQFIRRNTDRPLGEAYGLLAFDPNILGAALVSYADSVG